MTASEGKFAWFQEIGFVFLMFDSIAGDTVVLNGYAGTIEMVKESQTDTS